MEFVVVRSERLAIDMFKFIRFSLSVFLIVQLLIYSYGKRQGEVACEDGSYHDAYAWNNFVTFGYYLGFCDGCRSMHKYSDK